MEIYYFTFLLAAIILSMTFSILSPKSMSSLDLLHKDHLSGLKPEGVGKTRSVEETNKHENKKKDQNN